MAPERELHKFPKGERCEFCGSRKWYLENGLRYCAKEGHQLQGYVEFDLGDEDFGQKGRVSRKEKQVKERVKRVLSGQQARDLYLECLQLILREQILWLVARKGHAAELETVVRDLWDLRTCGAPTVVHEDSASEGEPSLFSSQLDLTLDEHTPARTKRAQSWDAVDGNEWPVPRVMDTLGLCILGCVLLRIPTRIGDVARWARTGSIPYREAYWKLPQEMRDRLPTWYTTPLKAAARLAAFDQGELHTSVLNLALSYHHNYNMVLPPLNDVLMTLQYVRELGLPVEVMAIARRIPPIANLTFGFPLEKNRIRLIHQPEVLLVAVLVLATIHCFPFENSTAAPQDENGFLLPRLDWEKWRAVMAPTLSTGLLQTRVDYTDVTASQILAMGPAELDDYFAHLSLLTDAQAEETMLERYFPVEEQPSRQAVSETPEDETGGRLRTIQAQAASFDQVDQSGQRGGGAQKRSYYSYKSEDDLPPAGRDFFQMAAQLSGLSVPMLLRAVNMLEAHIIVWQREQRRAASERRERSRSVMNVDSETEQPTSAGL
ncbi:hypothetical protein LX32DRAFT_640750 [Colletotrichum zoysiae]|uniref:Forms a complex with the other RRN protein RRN6 and RRN11 n=1 Tax=Colletotrichum zoysiae TaxID=1216348 RepID=A0AAD9HGR7_9PEZI|nr:hypothetical protein LX32DRAFT_640750 [Colletotrichum zoysiae]